jgi:hypothetical protein
MELFVHLSQEHAVGHEHNSGVSIDCRIIAHMMCYESTVLHVEAFQKGLLNIYILLSVPSPLQHVPPFAQQQHDVAERALCVFR